MCEYFVLCFFNFDIIVILLIYIEELCGMFFYEFSNCIFMNKIILVGIKCVNNLK